MTAAAKPGPARDLPLPEFFDPWHAADWSYRPDENSLMAEARRWKKLHDIAPSVADDRACAAAGMKRIRSTDAWEEWS